MAPQPPAAPAPAAPAPEKASASTDTEAEVAALRAALASASREVIERVVWEVVPELAETILREQIEKWRKERGPIEG